METKLKNKIVEQLTLVASNLGIAKMDTDEGRKAFYLSYGWRVNGVESSDGTNVGIASAKMLCKSDISGRTGFAINDIYYNETTGEIIRRGRFTEL